MAFFLDSNVCVDALRGEHPTLRTRFESVAPREVKVPSMVLGELLLGAAKSAHPDRNRRIVREFLHPFEIIAFDESAAEAYARIRAALEARGQRIGGNDLIIAAATVSANGVLITANAREFGRVPGLRFEDWTTGGD